MPDFEFEEEELEYDEEKTGSVKGESEEGWATESERYVFNDENRPTAPEAEFNSLKADRITEYLFSEERHSGDSSYIPEFYQADIENDIDRFKSLTEVCGRLDFPFPCVQLAGRVPIPIDFASPWLDWHVIPFEPYPRFYWNSFERIREYFAESSSVDVQYVNTQSAVSYFKQLLKTFISTRIGADSSSADRDSGERTTPPSILKPPPGVGFVKGLPFRVITTTHGLRVHYSPAYFFNPNLVFGSRTSPVDGYMQPGRYIFGVAGGAITGVKFSSAEFDIPGHTEADLLEL